MFLLRIVFLASLVVCASTSTANNSTKDVIGFPESEEDQNSKNKNNRQPVFLPAMCPENELFYPGDQKDDWICDCRPSHLYHPKSDACWPAFRKGPCEEGQYLMLHQSSDIPVCEKNPCVADGFVTWNGKCERLGSTGPCNFMYTVPAVLGVNATTLVVSCIRIEVPSRVSESIPAVPLVCPPGCKRSINGKCVSMQ